MFARLATTNGRRALLDAEERRELLVVHLRPEPDEARRARAVAVGVEKSSSAIGSARSIPATSPAVAIAIVNQNDVRTTSRRCAASGESK